MNAVQIVDVVHYLLVHEGERTVPGFFGWLKNETQPTRQLDVLGLEYQENPQRHGHMGIMPAGVIGAKDTVDLLPQGIHISAHSHRDRAGSSGAIVSYDAGHILKGGDVAAVLTQKIRDKRGGLLLLPAHFWMLMQVVVQ